MEGGRASLPDELFSELECLFTGDLGDEVQDVGPYLVRFRSWGEAAGSYMQKAMEQDIGSLVLLAHSGSDAELAFSDVHRHFRKFNIVYGPDARPLFFRYFDPRVLDSVLPILTSEQLQAFFGPVQAFLTRHRSGGVQELSMGSQGLSVRAITAV